MNNTQKKFIGAIYLHDGKVKNSLKGNEYISEDPVSFACALSDKNVDEIMVFDQSEGGNDAAHEKALDIIKDICKAVDVPVIGAGNVNRMEDVKKLLYAGCKRAALNFSKQSNFEILKEVSEKFGKDKILACFTEKDKVKENEESVLEYVSELFFLSGSCSDIKEAPVDLPLSVILDECPGDEICNIFEKYDFVNAVTGSCIYSSIDNISSFKDELLSKGFKICALEPKFKWSDLKKNSDGMVPVIVQDYRTDQVLMLAYMNEEAYNKTLITGKMTYFSRSRNELWLKGETSSHYQYVKSLCADCDLDTILAKVRQIGAACHTGSYSCFFNEIAKTDYSEKNPQKVLDSVFEVIKDRKVNPRQGSYTNYLFDKGIDKILKKVGEEATEMVIAAKNPNDNEIVYEMSDFLYHMMVLMAEKNVSWEDITDELSRR